jgi:hypothetical protein
MATSATIQRRRGMRGGAIRSLVVTAGLAGALLVPACSGDTVSDGWVQVLDGQAYDFTWKLLAEVRDGEYTGCLRVGEPDQEVSELEEQCGDPNGLVVGTDSSDTLRFGSVPSGIVVSYEPSDDPDDVGLPDEVPTDSSDAVPGFEFFGVTTDRDIARR